MKATKLHAWRDADLARLGEVLHEAFILWRQAWGLSCMHGASVTCAAAEAPPRETWQPLDTGAASGAWVKWSPVAQAELQTLFASRPGCSPLVEEAAAACMRDACRRLAKALVPEQAGSWDVDLPSGKWSGAVVATLPCGSRVLAAAASVQHALHRSSDPVRPQRPAQPALVPLLEAASGWQTRVEARLADCDLDVATLQRLRIGDVIRVPHPLSQPLCLRDDGGRAVFGGYLARSGACRAIELAATSA